MIDTDKYEGHAEGPWCWDGDILRNYCNDFSHNHNEIDCNVNLEILEVSHANDLEFQLNDADRKLIAAAPLLLEEVKRLRELKIAEEDELERLCNRAILYEDEYKLTLRGNQKLAKEVKRLREQLLLNRSKVTIDDWDKSGPCVTVYLEGCEYVGMLSLYKDENGKVIE